jgi:tripartite-type tricarboxylate transporter receptor subunit TctC
MDLLRTTQLPLNYASAGEGTIPHLAAEMLLRKLDVDKATSPEGLHHEGAAPAINALVRGQAQWMFLSLFSALPYLKSGKIKALATATPARLPEWPNIPTLAEWGLEDFDLTQWYALFAPSGTPPTRCARANGTGRCAGKNQYGPRVIAACRDRTRPLVQNFGVYRDFSIAVVHCGCGHQLNF